MTTPPGARAADLAQIAADLDSERERRAVQNRAPDEPTDTEPPNPRAADLRQIEADLAANRR